LPFLTTPSLWLTFNENQRQPLIIFDPMKKTLFHLIALLASLAGTTAQAQSLPKDSLYFVHLKDGSTIYSNKVKLVNSLKGKYLLLDSNKRIPLSQALDFKGWQGTFAIGHPGGQYDAYRLQNEGRRISLYSQCYYETDTYFASTSPDGPTFPTTITTQRKALYFRKGEDGDIQPLSYQNLKVAMADNPASIQQLQVARTNIYLGVGLLAGGVALTVAGVIHTVQENNNAQAAFKTASANWYQQSMQNPNTPLPSLPPHYGPSALTYIGGIACLSAIIPLANSGKHAQKALDIYNGID
jgi:hypothetical protein